MLNARSIGRTALIVLWGCGLIAGFWKLFLYSQTEGNPARPGVSWPKLSKISHKSHMPTLLVFVHPRCPCSDATIAELDRLMPRLKGHVSVLAVFFKPDHWTIDDVQESLWTKTQSIPGVGLLIDERGGEASLFDARTSGQVMLYDSNDRLIFSGGITPSRGHQGPSAGQDAILNFLDGLPVVRSRAPVYGCSLHNPERAPAANRAGASL